MAIALLGASRTFHPNGELMLQLVNMKMPFGKYKGTVLCNLPVSYLEWFKRKGFPKGKLGMLLATDDDELVKRKADALA